MPPRKDGSIAWGVRWREGGKNRNRVFNAKRDAEAWDAEVKRRRRLGELGMYEHKKKTVAELYDSWLGTHGADLAPKTLLVYDGAWRTLIEPHLGAHRLTELTPLSVEQWARARLAEGRGEASVEKGWHLLSSMFGRAEAWGWVQKNPVRLAKSPRKRNVRRRPTVLSPAEVEALREAMKRPMDSALVSVLAYAGLRPGEALALRWSDVGRTHVAVNKAMSLGEVKSTKTGKSRRVPLIAPLRSDLLQWRFRNPGPGDHPVFPNFQGEHWTEHDWRAWGHVRLKPALRAAGLPEQTRAYDLRHTAATLLLKSGLSVVETAARMGHSPTMCLNTYQHVIEEFEGRTIDLEAEILKARQIGKAAVGEAAMGQA